MIKKLRQKLIAITMVLMTVVLTVILFFVYHATKAGLEEANIRTLQAVSVEKGPHTKPGSDTQFPSRPCFMLRLTPEGELVAAGSDYYDLDDPDELMKLLQLAQRDGAQNGLLRDQALRFVQLEDGRGVAYAFMDVSSELQTLSQMNIICGVIFAAGLVVFLLISILLSRWATRPVERAWIQQRQFVADASHELKTPLTVILTNAELLDEEVYDAERKKQFAASILTMARQMRGLVEELLDQARVDSGKTAAKQEQLDYSKLVDDAALPFEPVYFEAGRELVSNVEPGITAVGSPDLLRRVVEILLDNGWKYSAAGAQVELRLRRQGRGSLLTVHSPGVPLTAQQCEDIFKRFYRMDSVRTMNHSYGLGLSIAQGIVQQHRGKIWAQSHDGVNVFYVSLPK